LSGEKWVGVTNVDSTLPTNGPLAIVDAVDVEAQL